ncbi:hypothetical protein H0O03_04765 [Candidatus Micrarchaeota archaeon]|nr:hypothetical protein [Candidatus Micrarchaeota archaeon]
MNPKFVINYSEFRVIEELTKYFSRKDGFVILIPTSLQNKGFDVVIFNSKTDRGVKIQVKGGRSFSTNRGERNRGLGNYVIWHSNFLFHKGIVDFDTDWVVIHATVPVPSSLLHPKKKNVWNDIFFLVRKEKLLDFLHEDKEKTHYRIYFNLDEGGNVVTASSFDKTDKLQYLFENQVEQLRNEIEA